MKKANIISLIFAGFLLAGYTPAAQADFAGVVNFLEKAPWASSKNALIYAGVNFGAAMLPLLYDTYKCKGKYFFSEVPGEGVISFASAFISTAGMYVFPYKGIGNFGLLPIVMVDSLKNHPSQRQFVRGLFIGIVPVAAALGALYFFGDKV